MLQADHMMMKYFSTVLKQVSVKQQIAMWFCFKADTEPAEYFPVNIDRRNRFEHQKSSRVKKDEMRWFSHAMWTLEK